jgi:integrase
VAGAGDNPDVFRVPATLSATPEIISYLMELFKRGRSQETISNTSRRLKYLSELCNLKDPEQAREAIASKQTWKLNTKRTTTAIYDGFLKFCGIKWQRPDYKKQTQLYFIPTEQELDILISAGNTTTAGLLQFLKETASRIGEATRVKWTDYDPDRKVVSINYPEKGSLPRILPISDKLIAMLNALPKKRETIFSPNKDDLRDTFDRLRKRTAKKIGNPRLLKISFHTFRHWKATMEYHKTKDIIHVKNMLGHKNIETTMVYINIEQALFLQETDEWTCKVAHNEQEAIALIEANFQYVNNLSDNVALYRKRK